MTGKGKLKILTLLILFVVNAASAQNCGIPDVNTFGSVPSGTSVYVYWTPVTGALSYNVEYRIRNIGAAYSAPSSTSVNSFTITNLLPLTNYEFIVQSVCGADSSAFSASGWFTTPAGGNAVNISRGPYLTGASSNSMIVQWKTDVASNSEVRFGTSVNNLSEVANSTASSTSHSVHLSSLLPDTKYYYSVGTVGSTIQATAENYFYTAPSTNDTVPLRFWVTGDIGTGTSAQTAVRDAFANHTSGQKINGWLWLGDNAYSNGLDQEYQNNVFNIYPNQLKNIPLFPALGNHDYAQAGYLSAASLGTNFPYFDIFDIPSNSGTEKYYSVNIGNVHLVALDSYGSHNEPNSVMYNWLESDLSTNTQQWTIVYFHHPPYTKGSHDSDNSVELVDMRNNIIPLLESNGVDLVLGGHSHSYERSYFIKGHYGLSSTFNSSFEVEPGGGPYSKTTRTGDGTVYLVCGVSGQTSPTSPGWPHNAMYYSSVTQLGSLILDINGSSLSCKFLTSNESIADQFTITKQISGTTSVSNNIFEDKGANFTLYPNPASNEFNLQVNGFEDRTYTVNIYNLFGQVIYKKTTDAAKSKNGIRISKDDMKNYTPGMYYVSLSGEKNTVTKSLILE